MNFKKEYDTIVIGAGPSGVKAALRCSKKGLKVLIIDSNQNSGGQIYRAPPKSYVKKSNKSLEENLIQIKFSKHLMKPSYFGKYLEWSCRIKFKTENKIIEFT